MSKTALLDALKEFDVRRVRTILEKKPALRDLKSDNGFDLLQMCCARSTHGNREAAARQVELAKYLIGAGFDPHVTHTTRPGEDGEEKPATLSLVFFAVARARNNRLVRYLLDLGVKPEGFFAAAWWGNREILADLVRHGADLNVVVGATPVHMAVAVLDRGVEGKPALARERMRTLEEFLRLGADPNIGEFRGDSPLHTALRKAYDPSVLAVLLKYGANPDVKGRDGRTVREIAARKRDRRYIAAIENARKESGAGQRNRK